jgi:acetyltransferase-like isoleucine patch superfamily enzyme
MTYSRAVTGVSNESVFDPARRAIGELTQQLWDRLGRWATIGPRSSRARRFRQFGDGSAICFPLNALFGEEYIELGADCIIGPYTTLSAGVMPGHVLEHSPAVRIGDRCLIGKGNGIVAHRSIEIGDDVFTGHHVYITDANHGYEDTALPIGRQFAPPRPVRIGEGSWLGHGTIVLPGATIGRHVVVGAGAVVTGELPDFSVAVGNPTRVIRHYETGKGWVSPDN